MAQVLANRIGGVKTAPRTVRPLDANREIAGDGARVEFRLENEKAQAAPRK